MGKLIKNGVEYGGSNNKAQAIAYDNSTSKLGAITAQGAIDELDAKDTEHDNRLFGLEERIQRIGINSEAYKNGSSCYLLLCKVKIDGWGSGTLIVTSSFWGIQHGSADIIAIVCEKSSVATGSAWLRRTKLGNKSLPDRIFYYKIVDGYIYIYAYVAGGNQHGAWYLTLNAGAEMTLFKEGSCTSDMPTDIIEIPDAAAYVLRSDVTVSGNEIILEWL